MDSIYSVILHTAASTTACLSALIDAYLNEKPTRSMAGLARRSGIRSRGYLNDVHKGRRKLHPKYRHAFCEALDLNPTECKIFHTLFEIEEEKAGSAVREHLAELLSLHRKALSVQLRRLPTEFSPEAFYVFSAFGLFGNRPSSEDLVSYFGEPQRQMVLDQLKVLQERDLIVKDRDGQRFSIRKDGVVFTGSDDKRSHLRILKGFIRRAEIALSRWFHSKEESYFESTVISVRASDWQTMIGELKAQLLEAQCRLESGNGDRLVQFNVQIFPVK